MNPEKKPRGPLGARGDRKGITKKCNGASANGQMPTLETNGLLDAALAYAGLGYAVFPCVPGRKTPLTTHGFHDATCDPDTIEEWWSKNPDANIGLPTDGLLVVDVDGADNLWPHDNTKATDLLAGAMARTPRGGCHYFFRQPGNKPWRNTASKLAESVDTRADGGYVVAPPSMCGSNKYTWCESLELRDGPSELPEPPSWLIDELDKLSKGKPTTAAHADADGTVAEGARNDTLASLAGYLRRGGFGETEIRAALLEVNERRCDPPLPNSEIADIAASVAKYEPDQITQAGAENWAAKWLAPVASIVESTPEIAPKVDDPGPIPLEMLRVPGFINDVIDFCLDTAPYPNPVMAFCGAMCLQAVLAGRKVRDAGGVRTNLYLLGLAHSGAGKDWPRQVNTRILHGAGLGAGLGDRFASGEGIQDALFLNPSMLFQTDEIDGLLQSINRSSDARHEGIMGQLLTFFGDANSISKLRVKAGKEQTRSIVNPCLVLFGTAIPKNYYEALSPKMLQNGFFSRMMVFEGGKRADGQNCIETEVPRCIADVTQWWSDFAPGGGNLADQNPTPYIVPTTDDAADCFGKSRAAADEKYRTAEARGDDVAMAIWARVHEQARKLALLYAISERHDHPCVTAEAAQWASTLAEHMTLRMLFMASQHVSSNEQESLRLKIKSKLREAPNNMLTRSVLLRKMRLDAKRFVGLIQTLELAGEIECGIQKTGGRDAVAYRLK